MQFAENCDEKYQDPGQRWIRLFNEADMQNCIAEKDFRVLPHEYEVPIAVVVHPFGAPTWSGNSDGWFSELQVGTILVGHKDLEAGYVLKYVEKLLLDHTARIVEPSGDILWESNTQDLVGLVTYSIANGAVVEQYVDLNLPLSELVEAAATPPVMEKPHPAYLLPNLIVLQVIGVETRIRDTLHATEGLNLGDVFDTSVAYDSRLECASTLADNVADAYKLDWAHQGYIKATDWKQQLCLHTPQYIVQPDCLPVFAPRDALSRQVEDIVLAQISLKSVPQMKRVAVKNQNFARAEASMKMSLSPDYCNQVLVIRQVLGVKGATEIGTKGANELKGKSVAEIADLMQRAQNVPPVVSRRPDADNAALDDKTRAWLNNTPPSKKMRVAYFDPASSQHPRHARLESGREAEYEPPPVVGSINESAEPGMAHDPLPFVVFAARFFLRDATMGEIYYCHSTVIRMFFEQGLMGRFVQADLDTPMVTPDNLFVWFTKKFPRDLDPGDDCDAERSDPGSALCIVVHIQKLDFMALPCSSFSVLRSSDWRVAVRRAVVKTICMECFLQLMHMHHRGMQVLKRR